MGDAGAIFRAALASAGHSDLADIATTLRRGEGDAPRTGEDSHRDRAGPADETSPEGRPRMKLQATVPFQQPVAFGGYAPPDRSSAPPPFVHRHPQEISASYAAAPPAIGSRPHDAYLEDDESRPSAPGPLLSTIVPRKPRRLLRVGVSVVVGIIAAVATYAAVVRLRSANATNEPAVTATPPPAPGASTAPLAATSAPLGDAGPGPSVSASAAASAAPVASSTAAKTVTAAPKRRPRRVPKPPVTPASAATPAPPPPPAVEPAPAPPPPPPPPRVPQDSVPRMEDP